jgi:hypothetical protein
MFNLPKKLVFGQSRPVPLGGTDNANIVGTPERDWAGLAKKLKSRFLMGGTISGGPRNTIPPLPAPWFEEKKYNNNFPLMEQNTLLL